ncbi:hypothetical protein, partial [Salmonella sp. s51228]|uniref:hypothetical protein n=1 Tax=Salmonella sp. s51228 TaxID=3159652 RepID=UPI00398173A6
KNIKDFMLFASSILVERTDIGQRVSVKENEYRCHVYIRSDLLSCVVISNLDYLPRVALTLAANAIEVYASDFEQSLWATTDDNYSYPPIDNLL